MTAALRENLKASMAEKDLGVRAAARAAGLDHGGLSRFLAGKNDTLALGSVTALAGALGTTVAELLGEAGSADGDIIQLRLEQIDRGGLNPRRRFDPLAMAELEASIREHGVLQNIVVKASRSGEDRYEIVAGERRVMACLAIKTVGDWPEGGTVPSRLVEADDTKHLVLALLENLNREDLTPFEEAEAFACLRDQLDWSTLQIAEAIRRTQRHVQLRLQLLELSPPARNALVEGLIGPAVARHLARLDEAGQQSMVDRIKAGSLAADERQVRLAVGRWQESKAAGEEAARALGQLDMEDELDEEEDGGEDDARSEQVFDSAWSWERGDIHPAWPAGANEHGVYTRDTCQILEHDTGRAEAQIFVVQGTDGRYRACHAFSFHSASIGMIGSGGLPSVRDHGHEWAHQAVATAAGALANRMADLVKRADEPERKRSEARKLYIWARDTVTALMPSLLSRISQLETPPTLETQKRSATPAAPEPEQQEPEIPAPAPAEQVAAVRDALAEEPLVALRVLAASMMACTGPVRVRPMLASACHSELGRLLDQDNQVWPEISKVFQGGDLVELKGDEGPVGLYQALRALTTGRLLELVARLTAIRVGPADCIEWDGKSLLGLIHEDLGLDLEKKEEAAE